MSDRFMVNLDALAFGAYRQTLAKGYPTETLAMGGYLHLEVSELIEAVRGKHGDPECEAADVLFQLLATIHRHGLNLDKIICQLKEQC